MKKKGNTTIQVSLNVKKKLDSLKKYRRETYNDVIERILKDQYMPNKETGKDATETKNNAGKEDIEHTGHLMNRKQKQSSKKTLDKEMGLP